MRKIRACPLTSSPERPARGGEGTTLPSGRGYEFPSSPSPSRNLPISREPVPDPTRSYRKLTGDLAELHSLGRLAVPVQVGVPDPEMTNDECLMTKEARRTKP